MKNLYLSTVEFLNDEAGVTAIEYALIASLIAVVIIAAVKSTGHQVCVVFADVATKLGVSTTCN